MRACYDSDAYMLSCTNLDSTSKQFFRKCTEAASSYCASWTLANENVKYYGCTADPVSSQSTVESAGFLKTSGTAATFIAAAVVAPASALEAQADTDGLESFTFTPGITRTRGLKRHLLLELAIWVLCPRHQEIRFILLHHLHLIQRAGDREKVVKAVAVAVMEWSTQM